jgi:hypothetical protein
MRYKPAISEAGLAVIRNSTRYRFMLVLLRMMSALVICFIGVVMLMIVQVFERTTASLPMTILFLAMGAVWVVSLPVIMACSSLMLPHMRDERGLPSMEKTVGFAKVAFRDLLWLRSDSAPHLYGQQNLSEPAESGRAGVRARASVEFFELASYRTTIGRVRPLFILGVIAFVSLIVLVSAGRIEERIGVVAVVTAWLVAGAGVLKAWRGAGRLVRGLDHNVRQPTRMEVFIAIMHDLWRKSRT